MDRPPLMFECSVALPEWCASYATTICACASEADRMAVAVELSRRNVVEQTGGPFGAAVFRDLSGELLAVGVNRVVPLSNSSLHAEVVALMLAERSVGSFSLDVPDGPLVLYTSCEPCAMCLGAIWWSGVSRVVCGATRADATGIGFDEGPVFAESYAYLAERGVRIDHGVLRVEARQVLLDYAATDGAVYNA